jgi:hypothetical protein
VMLVPKGALDMYFMIFILPPPNNVCSGWRANPRLTSRDRSQIYSKRNHEQCFGAS